MPRPPKAVHCDVVDRIWQTMRRDSFENIAHRGKIQWPETLYNSTNLLTAQALIRGSLALFSATVQG
jgi:hypothetical protein